MRERAEINHLIQLIEQFAGYSLLGIGAAAAFAGLLILFFWIPARTTIVRDGRQGAERELRASIISNGVYTNGVKFASYRVDDVLRFSADSGEDIRVHVRRPISRDPATLIWYSPADPRRFTTRSPLRCFAFAGMCVATAAWLQW